MTTEAHPAPADLGRVQRWALIAVLAALANGRVALAAVVGWGLLAAAYTLGLRSLRSVSMRVGVLDTVDTSRHRDDGRLPGLVLGYPWSQSPLAVERAEQLADVDDLGLQLDNQERPGCWMPRNQVDDAALAVDREGDFGPHQPANANEVACD